MGFGLGPMELAIVGVIAVLLFGNKLPEVGRSLAKGIVEFKKGLNDIKQEMDIATSDKPAARVSHRNAIDDYDEPTAPKFEPPTREPVESQTNEAPPAEV